MKLNDTIVAESSPSGKGATSVIRLSGLNSINIVDKIFPSKNFKLIRICL